MATNVSAKGRWQSPDPLGGDISNPQSLNRYAYALNNPTTLIDPLGLGPIEPCGGGPGSSGWMPVCTPGSLPAVGFFPTWDEFQGLFPGASCEDGVCESTYDPNGMDFVNGGGGGGGGGGAPPPKPAPPSLQVSTLRLITDVNRCAAQKADSLSAASLLGVQNNTALNALFGSSTASLSRLVFGTNPSEYVPEGLNLVAGAKAGTALNATVQTAGRLEVNQGFQSIFTAVAPTTFGQTAFGQAIENTAARTADFLDIAGKGLFLYDAAAYVGSLVACTQ